MKQRLEPVVVHDAAAAADLRRDAVGALLDPAGRFGIDRGTVANPLPDGVQVCHDLRVDAGEFGFGGAHTGIVMEWLVCHGERYSHRRLCSVRYLSAAPDSECPFGRSRYPKVLPIRRKLPAIQ